jgi:hypothetical protein
MSQWQPARAVDLVLRFNSDFGPAMRAAVEGATGANLPPEDRCREACRALARGVGVATHAYLWAAPEVPVTHVRLPVDVDADGTLVALRIRLNTPMNSPVDYSNGQSVATLLQTLMGLPRGSLAGVDVAFPAPATMGEAGPLLTMLNPSTLPGQKLCEYCRNPMPDYEVQCRSCGARAER